jgi:hypothetical protein
MGISGDCSRVTGYSEVENLRFMTKPGHLADPQESKPGFVDVDQRAAPNPSRYVALDLFHLGGGGAARLEKTQERLFGSHCDPLGNQGPAVRSHAVDAPAVAVHEVHQDAHMAAV